MAVALTTLSQLAGFLFAMGAAQSLSYFIARQPEDGPSLLTTWMLMLIPLAALAIGVSELLLPVIFGPDDGEAIEIGRWFLFTTVLIVGVELNYGLLLGTHDFLVYNALRLAQPALMAASFVVLWPLGELTVTHRPDRARGGHRRWCWPWGCGDRCGGSGSVRWTSASACSTLWFGLRGQGATVANHVTARLDVAMLPAFVAAGERGALLGGHERLPDRLHAVQHVRGARGARRRRRCRRGTEKVIGSFWAAMAVAVTVALGLLVFARPLLGFVYGDSFRGAATSLRLLLPGAVLFAGAVDHQRRGVRRGAALHRDRPSAAGHGR